MNNDNGDATAGLGVLWHVWEEMTRELIRQERTACHPFAVTRFDDCDAFLESILCSVRQARASAVKMKNNFPGFPPKQPVTPKEP